MKGTFDDKLAYRRNLPHFQSPGGWYHVVFSLIPGVQLPPECCARVLDACRKWDGIRWYVAACVAMPKLGTHVLCSPMKSAEGGWYRLSYILHDVKGSSAWQINQLLGTRGRLWEHESYDRTIRSQADFWTVANYIANNPVKDGLVSSATDYPYLYLHTDLRFGLEGVSLRGVGELGL